MSGSIIDKKKKKQQRSFETCARCIMYSEDISDTLAFLQNYQILNATSQLLCSLWLQEFVKVCQLERTSPKCYTEIKMEKSVKLLHFLYTWLSQFNPTLTSEEYKNINNCIKQESDIANNSDYPVRIALQIVKNDKSISCRKTHSPSFSHACDSDEEYTTPSCLDFFGMDPKELARQLTLREFAIFKAIRIEEFFDFNLNSETKKIKSPNIYSLIRQFNQVGNWVALEILQTKKTTDQANAIRRFIYIATECMHHNNFNTCMSIFSAINSHPIQRLKAVWSKIGQRSQEQFKRLETLMTPMQNFTIYRQKLNSCKLPIFPYFGIFMHDFTFIYDGNKKYTSSGSVNFDLLKLLHTQLQNLDQFKSVDYDFQKDPKIQQFLLRLTAYDNIDEEFLDKISLEVQPSLWAKKEEKVKSTKTSKNQESSDSESSSSSSSMRLSLCMDSSSLEMEEEFYSMADSSDEFANTTRKMRTIKKNKTISRTEVTTTIVHDSMIPACLKIEGMIEKLFATANMYQWRKEGIITIADQRYLMLRASSISSGFLSNATYIFNGLITGINKNDFIPRLLFSLARIMGTCDAVSIFGECDPASIFDDAMENKQSKLSKYLCECSVRLSYMGWGFIKIMPESNINPDNMNEFVIHIEHSTKHKNFECDSFSNKSCTPEHPVCAMNSGYLSGWLSHCAQHPLVAVEVTCIARGDSQCHFIIAPQAQLELHIQIYSKEKQLTKKQIATIILPHLKFQNMSKHYNFSPKPQRKNNSFLFRTLQPASLSSNNKNRNRNNQSKSVMYTPHEEKKEKKEKKKILDKKEKKSKKMLSKSYSTTKIDSKDDIKKAVQTIISGTFNKKQMNPEKGLIMIGDERHVLIRGQTLAGEFKKIAIELLGDKEMGEHFALNLLFDIGRSMGISDYDYYLERMKLSDLFCAEMKLYLLCLLSNILSSLGMGRMMLYDKNCNFTIDPKTFFMRFSICDSFESTCALQNTSMVTPEKEKNAGKKKRHTESNTIRCVSKHPVCTMTTGYINGFLTKCVRDIFKLDVVALETKCRANGSKNCEFYVSSPITIESFAAENGYTELPLLPIIVQRVKKIIKKDSNKIQTLI